MKGVEIIHGFIYPSPAKDKNTDSSSDEDEEENEEYIDATDIKDVADGGSFIKASPLKVSTVTLKMKENTRELKVTGKFWSIDPWWEVTVKVGHNSKKLKYVKGYPAYKLRSDIGVLQDNITMLFLKSCGVAEEHRNDFNNCVVNEMGLGCMLTFEHFEDLLKDFGDRNKECEEIAKSINSAVNNSLAGKMVLRCQDFAELFVYLPQLIPKKFLGLMNRSFETLTHLQDAVLEEPWIFGFSPILVDRFRLYGCEASLQSFADCGLLDQFPQIQKDAIHVYTQLKINCTRFGHTYNERERLFQDVIRYLQYHLTFKRMKAALDFLESNYIIHVSRESNIMKIYLKYLWKAEQTIAHHITELLSQHLENPCQIELDFQREEFDQIRSDCDQLKAAKKISSGAVTVLSGRGGCGKTTVVSKVCQPAEQQILAVSDKRDAERMFEESDIDDTTLSQAVAKMEGMNYGEIPCCSSTTFCPSPVPTVTSHGINRQKKKKRKKTLTQRQMDLGSDAPDSEPDEAEEEDPRREYPVVLLTAPTGKAANLLGKRAKLSSFTLHQIIYSYKKWKAECNEADESEKPRPKWKFYRVNILVVDECSLVSVTTFSAMLDMLMSEAKIRKLVLLGDILQLPSIEPGNFLTDVFCAMDVIGCSVLLRTNHRSDGELITANAGKIANQMYPIFREEGNFIKKNIEEGPLIVQPHCSRNEKFQNNRDDIVKQMREMELNQESCQFVAFRRNDCNSINEICSQHYVKHSTKGPKKNRFRFEIGDKVCCTKNALVKDKLTKTTLRLCNGEIFFIKDDVTAIKENGKRKRYLLLYDPESENIYKINFSVLRHECKLRHAWARTIHTYQGSESEVLVYVVGSPMYQTWQHVYTAVTRGRKKVILITTDEALRGAINRKPYRRFTGLRNDLEKKFAKLSDRSDNLPAKYETSDGPTFQSTSKSLRSKFDPRGSRSPFQVKTEPNERNDSQTFSDWGESFTDEVTRMVDETENENQFTIIKNPADFKPHDDETKSEPCEEGNINSVNEKYTKTVQEPGIMSKISPDGDSFSLLDNSNGQTSQLKNDAAHSQVEAIYDDVRHLMDDNDSYSPLCIQANAYELRNTSTESVQSGDYTLLSPHNVLHETFDDIRHLLDNDDSFSPPSTYAEPNESGESKFMTPNNVSSLSDPTGRRGKDVRSTERVSQHWADDSCDSTWSIPPQEPDHQSDTRQIRETLPRSDITGTPKRGATSPSPELKTPVKQQKLPPQVEKNVQITPVRDFFQNLATN